MCLGETVKLYLVNGSVNGVVCGYLGNWSGQCIKIPRNLLIKTKNRKEIDTSGIYFLFGKEEEEENLSVYVGEAENVYNRLSNHIKQKDFWTEAVVFTSKDLTLTKAHVRYLENKIIKTLEKNVSLNLMNSNQGFATNIPEYEESSMMKYFNNLKILLPALGYNIFNEVKSTSEKEDYLYIKNNEVDAKGYLTANSFVICGGSILRNKIGNSIHNGVKKRIEMLISKNLIQEINGKQVLVEDYEFSSSTVSAEIVLQRCANGKQSWKDKNGRTIKQIEEEEFKQADA